MAIFGALPDGMREKVIADYTLNPSRATVERLAQQYSKTIRSIVAILTSAGKYEKGEFSRFSKGLLK
jgi:hypothetical protein